ncbi:UNVERIFIED_CONTAM: hypothetical protein Sradi_4644100 [Sesamum radiatum]|uniref:Uncharacterized protein n=1 Tax=Sesamum radiatum TaxID=300843 RepID=A0AAW2NE91_SESRA
MQTGAYLPNKYMLIAIDFSFGRTGGEPIIFPVVLSIETKCASLVKKKTISVADSLPVPSSELLTLFSQVSGEVLTATEMTGDIKLDTESVTNKTEGELVSSTATCNRAITILD